MNVNIEISPIGNMLIYKKCYTVEFILRTIKENNLSGLKIFSQLEEQKLFSLDFLKELTFLEKLDITSSENFSFSFLNYLENLKELSINVWNLSSYINFENQTKLKTLSINWDRNKIVGLNNCQNLEVLYLSDFNEEDLTSIKDLKQLKSLTIATSTIKTLKGLEFFEFLEEVSLGYCKKLKLINEVNGNLKLRILKFENCANINNFDILNNLPNLEILEIGNCKGINSIKFIKNFPKLSNLNLFGNTNIIDGDLSPAQKFKNVNYIHRKHYNVRLKTKELDELVERNKAKIKDMFKGFKI